MKSALFVPAHVELKSVAACSIIPSCSTPNEDSSDIALLVSNVAVTGAASASASCKPAPVITTPVFCIAEKDCESLSMPLTLFCVACPMCCIGPLTESTTCMMTLSLYNDSNPIAYLSPPCYNQVKEVIVWHLCLCGILL